MLLVYRYRVKSLNGLLNKQSRAVNYVWNFANDTQKHALKWNKRWPTGFDLNKLTAGSSKELGLHSGTVNATSLPVNPMTRKLNPSLVISTIGRSCPCASGEDPNAKLRWANSGEQSVRAALEAVAR